MIEHDLQDASHREGCPECTEVWTDLERIGREARALPTLRPSRDLWAGIEGRIAGITPEADAAGAAPRAAPGSTPWMMSGLLRMAAAAVILVASTATVTWQLATRGRPDLPAVAAGGAADGGSEASPVYRQASYDEDFGAMDREIAMLESVVATQRARLDPATVAILERNLAVIDRAITESRAAFLQDPASRFLAVQLARSYSSKLTLLRDMATLPAGT